MQYFVTGATGFIGRFLIARLLERRNSKVYVLMRRSSKEKFEALRERLGADEERLLPVWGDITEAGLVSKADRKKLAGKIDHVFHLAAVYDMNMSDAQADQINNQGTRNLVEFANGLGGEVRLHHVSSIAVAGNDFVGNFTETMFDEGQRLDHPYYRSKFESEKIVRDECQVPFRIYRPGAVVGHSETGEMDKIDGPYYFFKSVQKIRDAVPKWLPLLGIEGGKMPIVPVDYVVNAMDHIAHKPGLDGQTFHLLQTPMPSVGETLAAIFTAAHGPEFATRLPVPDVKSMVPSQAKRLLSRLPISPIAKTVSKTIGIPLSVFGYISNKAEFDDAHTRRALRGSDIKCPRLELYAEKLWEYWEWNLDTEVKINARLIRAVRGKIAMVTGASSGIGFTVAKKLGKAGARVILVARGLEALEKTQGMIEKMGGKAFVYSCDLSDLKAIDACIARILEEHGHVDILVNNAGRSIRRAVMESLDRFHDFERTMQLNYFGAIRVVMNLLPSMAKRRKGQIINISSIGVLANAARFSAYVASKAALDAFSRCLSAEVKAYNIDTTTIYMPLVRTPMIAPTRMYDYVPALTPDQAANLVVKAIVSKPKRIKTPLGQTAELSYALWPKINDSLLSLGFQLFPSSAAAKGKMQEKPSPAAIALANVLPGQYM